MQIGIVGMPLSGKTTVFNALTKHHADVDGFAGGKQESHLGDVKVPDLRLETLDELFAPKKCTPTHVQYVDAAGLEKGSSEKGGLSDFFLGQLRTVDALLLVVRLFEDVNIMHPESSINPRRDLEIVTTEFLLSDLNIVEHRISKLEKTAQKTKIPDEVRELELMRTFQEMLENEQPLREAEISPANALLIRGYQFLTIKPLLTLINIGENQISKQKQVIDEYTDLGAKEKCGITALCAEIEMEIAQLDEDDQNAFLEDMGIEEPALARVIRESYNLLDLITFFTYVNDEVRAWTIPRGATAKQAAGAVHTDMERGFIRAEVASYTDLKEQKSIAHCREKGLLRLEGKDYSVQDGDVITFRFNI